MSQSSSPIPSQPKDHRVDQWALITEQKTLEERKARQYEHLLAQQKRNRLKEHLDAQIQEKIRKEQEQREFEKRYASEAIRRVQEVEMLEKLRKRETNQRRKQVEVANKSLFSGVIDSKVREQYENGKNGYSMDIGYAGQLERRRQVELAKRRMVDELDRQIQEKEKLRLSLRQKQKQQDKLNLSMQYQTFEKRKDQRHHSYHQYPTVQEHYQHLLERQHRKDQLFDFSRIELEAKRKTEEEVRKASQKAQETKLSNLRMKEILDNQVSIQRRKKQEEERVNPEDLSYGLLGRMLSNRPGQQSPSRQQQYYLELQKQIEEKQKKKEAQKYMTEEQYKINLNQLNRAVDGKFADETYIDRSIHALSEPHNVNVTLFDAKVEKPDTEVIRPTLEALKNRKRERVRSPPEQLYKL